MKKTFLTAALALTGLCANAQTQLLFEDFESWTKGYVPEVMCETTQAANGWTIIRDEQENSRDWWNITGEGSALAGKKAISAGSFTNYEKTKEDWLITPEVTLGTAADYKLELLWEGGSAPYCIEQGQYDMLIMVKEAGTDNWKQIFSQRNADDVEKAGVAWPWKMWTKYTISFDLSDYKGKTIQVGFVYKKLKTGWAGNVATIDNVSIEEYNKITGPIAETQTVYYNFPLTWVGSQMNSDIMKFTNVGVGTLEVESVEFYTADGKTLIPNPDFYTTIDNTRAKLKKNESYLFKAYYKPTLTGIANVMMKINIKDGEPLSIYLNGKKRIMPAGYTLEAFEGNVFPPVGWSVNGYWRHLDSSFSGDGCVYSSLSMEKEAVLVSPLLDLSGEENYTVSFDYLDDYQAMSDNAYAPENEVTLHLSQDGGKTWKQVWINSTLSEYATTTVDLGSQLGDSCKLMWKYAIPDIDFSVSDYEYSTFYLDNVVLPPLLGQGKAPQATEVVAPADGAKDQMNRGLTLQWKEAQFASDYKVYLGTADGTWDILDGVSSKGETTMTAPRLGYTTDYFWKVVPANDFGEAQDVPVWKFTTMADMSIKAFPYSQGFENASLPLGWASNKDNNTYWRTNEYGPYDGKYSAFATGSVSGTESSLVTPEIQLPADDEIQVSFFWGNNVGVSMEKDGTAKNTSTKSDGIDAVYFEINDGSGWKQLAIVSGESKAWIREAFSLSEYKGKNVQLRWRYELTNATGRRGAMLDNVQLASSNACLAYFNMSEWKAGEVNNGTSLNSGNVLSLVNGGTEEVEIASISFASANFESNIAAGTKIAANTELPFVLTYNAGTVAGEVIDKMTVTFADGKSVSLPVSATTLADDIIYYSFDHDEHATTKPQGFTVVDVDQYSTVMSSVIKYPHRGEPFAYIVLNVDKDHADWRNVYPRSGNQCLAAFATYSGEAQDWIISKKLKATDKSQFRFFGKSYATDDEFNDFTPHYATVCVSTTGTDVKSFTTVAMSKTELAYDKNGAFTEYTVDLSAFAGQEIYVGLKHTAATTAYVAFFDDFYFEHFEGAASGITTLMQNAECRMQNYNLNGQKVGNDYRGIVVKNGKKVIVK